MRAPLAALMLCLCATVAVAQETGLASFYGFESGRRTASGERFHPLAMTCAHRTRPFGQVVTVTLVGGARSVRCRINDRGPFVAGRIIDLSLGAARALGIERAGVVRVTVQ